MKNLELYFSILSLTCILLSKISFQIRCSYLIHELNYYKNAIAEIKQWLTSMINKNN